MCLLFKVYICVKLPPKDLNPDPYPPHPTSIYICGVTTASRVSSGSINTTSLLLKMKNKIKLP